MWLHIPLHVLPIHFNRMNQKGKLHPLLTAFFFPVLKILEIQTKETLVRPTVVFVTTCARRLSFKLRVRQKKTFQRTSWRLCEVLQHCSGRIKKKIWSLRFKTKLWHHLWVHPSYEKTFHVVRKLHLLRVTWDQFHKAPNYKNICCFSKIWFEVFPFARTPFIYTHSAAFSVLESGQHKTVTPNGL